MIKTMKAVVLEKPCSAEELKISEVPVPEIKPAHVLIKIKAFGINRAEIFTRNGFSPSVKLPRIIGIECVGIVEASSDNRLKKGNKVFTLMGGLGREFDGSYAEYTLVPSNQVYPFTLSEENWEILAAYPELYYTAYGSLFKSLRLQNNETLLIRGGTGSVVLAAIQLAKSINVRVAATTRNREKINFLRNNGADYVIIENENFEEQLKSCFPQGADKILELIGASALKSSLKSLKQGGTVCMTGCLGGWVLDSFEPLADIPPETYLTSFDSTEINKNTIGEMFNFIKKYSIKPYISKIFSFKDIGIAHSFLESDKTNGKIVIKVDKG